MQRNESSPNHYTVKSPSRRRDFFSLCSVLWSSRQLLNFHVNHSFKNRISLSHTHTPLTFKTPPLNTNKRTTEILHLLQISDFWCFLQKGEGIISRLFFIFISTKEAMINKRLLHLYKLFQNEVSLTEDFHAFNVVVRQQNVTSLLEYDHTVINTAHSYNCSPGSSSVYPKQHDTTSTNQFATQSQQTASP